MTKTATHNILYIEDNAANRQLVEFIFETRKELSLTLAVDGLSGIKKAIELIPSLILLDITLPDINGYEVLTKLKQTNITSKIPVVAVSGDSFPNKPQNVAYDFDRYLTKPINIKYLYETIDEILNLQELQELQSRS